MQQADLDVAPRRLVFARVDQRLLAHPLLLSFVAIASVVGGVLLVHRPVLDHYFFVDDFFPLADAATLDTSQYFRDTFLLRDNTPSWRFLSMAVYFAQYRAFGLNAFPFLLTSLLVHAGTSVLLFLLVRRATRAVWPAFLASAFFGMTAAHAPTVGHVTAFPHVLAGFLIMAGLLALYEGLDRRRLRVWLPVAVLALAGAIAANEPAAGLAPVFGLVVLWKRSDDEGAWREPRWWLRSALIAAPFALVGGAAVVGFSVCGCADSSGVLGAGDHVFWNGVIYLGRLLYPIGMEVPGEPRLAHTVAGSVVAALALWFLVRGPALARVSVIFLVLTLIPYLPQKWALAPRYVYTAAIPFSVLGGLLFAQAAEAGERLHRLLPAALAIAGIGLMGVFGWQTWQQNQAIAAESSRWRQLVTGLERRYPELPEGSRVIVRGGPLTDPYWQVDVLPSFARALYGPNVQLYTSPDWQIPYCPAPGGLLFVLDYDGGAFVPLIERSRRVEDSFASGRRTAFVAECPSPLTPPWPLP